MLFSITTLLLATAGLNEVLAVPFGGAGVVIPVGPRRTPIYRIQISTAREEALPGRINPRFISNLVNGTFFSASERFAGNFTVTTNNRSTPSGKVLYGFGLTINQQTGEDVGFPAMVLDGRDMMTLTGGPSLVGNSFRPARTANGGRTAAGEVFYAATGTSIFEAGSRVEAARPAPSNGVVLLNFCDETNNPSASKVILVSKARGCGTRTLNARLVRAN